MLDVTVLCTEDGDACPIRQALSRVSGKWQVLIVLTLEDGPLRFGELKRGIGDITQRVLTENLRSLQRDGHLTRTVHEGPPLAVTYELTEMGLALSKRFVDLAMWGAEAHPKVTEARARYDAAQG